MKARLIWCGPLSGPYEELTAPSRRGPYENSRFYWFPKPGFLRLWNERGQPAEDGSDDVRLPAMATYAVLEINDFFERRPSDTQVAYDAANQPIPVWEDKLHQGHERAKDLEQRWLVAGGDSPAGYGVVMIAGETPSDAELQRARELRQEWLHFMFTRAELSYRQGSAGKGGKTKYDKSELLIAKELGRRLPDTLEAAAKAEAETKECPHCAETIKAAARVCRYCGGEVGAEPVMAASGRRR